MKRSWLYRLLTTVTVLLVASPFAARAQLYPSKPIKIIVPALAGGTSDTLARMIGEKLTASLKQPVIVENRPGAGGLIGFEAASKAAPDGYTLVLGDIFALGVSSFRGRRYDSVKDFTPVSLVSQAPSVLLVQSSLPANSVRELIALAKARPDQIKFSSAGIGTQGYIAGQQLRNLGGASMLHVPYKGGANAASAFAEGQVEVTFASVPDALALARTGKARPLAVTGSARSSLAPALPTVAEAGVTGFNVAATYGVLLPAGAPREIVARLNSEIAGIVTQPDVRDRMARFGAEPVRTTPEQFAALVRKSVDQWASVARQTDEGGRGGGGGSGGESITSAPPAAAAPPPRATAAAPPPRPTAAAPSPAAAAAAPPRPEQPKAAAQPIVYNADISPQLPPNKAAPNRPVLKAGQAATLRFDIGPKWDSSLLPNATPSPEILNSKENVPLTVVLSCGFCEPHAESLMRMTYMPGQGRSDEIRFQFTPQRRPDGSTYADKLQLGIINDKTGREYDRLVIDVAVSDTTTAPVTITRNTAIAYVPSKGEARRDWSPDVLLYAIEEMGRNVTIAIEPVSDEMRRRLGPLALDAQGQRRTFRSGIDDATMVVAMTTSAYGVMSEVSLQGDFLKRLSAKGADAAVSLKSRQSLLLTDAESMNVSGIIANIGQRLYRHLFVNTADTDLRKLIVQLEAAAAAAPPDRPLRLKIITNQISVPWQYLHPVGPVVDAQNFWGLRFSLSVLRENTGARFKGAVPGTQQAHKVVFAQYGSSADPTVPLANEQAQQLRMLPLADADLVPVDSGSDLLAKLEQQRKEISVIDAFLHANFTTANSEPQLLFNDGDIVTSDRLEQLLNKLPMEEQDTRYLTRAPLVILNACETGPSVNLPHVSLENVMFQLGAQGVVVTEVSVWITLGHDVATRLISRLGKGEAIGDALTGTRRDLYAEKKNPLGLLYVYYGDPAATLRH